MDNSGINQVIVKKLMDGMKFGLLEDGKTCSFEDGTEVSYTELWSVLKKLNLLENKGTGPLFEQCKDSGLYKFIKRS